MKDVFLICAVAVMFVIGFFLMKKLDKFLENNHRLIAGFTEAHAIRIAFEDSPLIEAASNILEEFSGKNPDCELHLFTGSAKKITKKLAANELDFGFIVTGCADKQFTFVTVPLKQAPIVSRTAHIPAIPLDTEIIMTKVFWDGKQYSQNKKIFAEQLKKF